MRFDINKSLLFLLILALGITSCREGNSIYDPDFEPQPDPVITSITPEEGYLGGVDSIIVHGENFAENADEVTISFNGEAGIVLSATPTQIVARPARVFGDSIEVLVTSRGAVNFSNSYQYQLSDPIEPIPGYNQSHNTTGIAHNAEGDIFFNLQNEEGANRGIKVWRTNGEIEDYLPSQFNWRSIKFGPDGLLYGVNNNFGVYRENNGSIDTNPFAFGNSEENYRNIDFDADHFLWVVGQNENIIRINIDDGTITRFPFSANLAAVRYFEGKLFVGGAFEDDSEEGETMQEVWVFDLNNNEASNPQRVFAVGDELNQSMAIQEITFDEDGKMYLGTTSGSGIYTWTEEEGLMEFYQGMVRATGYSFTWFENYLIASIRNIGESTRHPLKINISKEGAPYMGVE